MVLRAISFDTLPGTGISQLSLGVNGANADTRVFVDDVMLRRVPVGCMFFGVIGREPELRAPPRNTNARVGDRPRQPAPRTSPPCQWG